MRKPRGLLAAAACLLLSAGAAAQSAALRDYHSGNGLLDRGLYDLAAEEYRRFLADHADHDRAAHARYGLAVCLFRLGDHRAAADELQRLEGSAGFEYAAEVLVMLGQSRLALGRPGEAAEVLGRAVREHSGHKLADDAAALQAEALYEAGRHDEVARPCTLLASRWPDSPQRQRAELFGGLAEMAEGDYAAAADRFEALLQRFPDGAHADHAALLLAQSLHRSGALKRAAEAYRRVITRARDEFLPDALYGLGLVMHRTGRYRAARQLLDELLQRYPGDELAAAARLLRGRAWFDLGQYDSAIADLDAVAAAGGPHGDEAAYWRAKCALRGGDPGDAARRLADALREFPASALVPQMIYDRAVALLRAGDPAGAAAALGDFPARYPEHELAPAALELAAAALHEQGRYRESLQRCRAFEQRFAPHELAADVRFLTAENTYLLEDYAEAADLYRAFLEAHPDHDRAGLAGRRLGLALYRDGRYEQAQPWLDRAAAAAGEGLRGPVLLALGDAQFQQGDWAAAQRHLREYLAQGLDRPSADDALLKLGLAQRRQGETTAALATFERLIGSFGDSPRAGHALFEKGQALLELDRPREAEAAFRAALAAGAAASYAGHAWQQLGAIAGARGDDEAAAGAYGRAAGAFAAAGQGEHAGEILYQQGQALVAAGRFEQASAVLQGFARDHASHERAGDAEALTAIALARRGDAGPGETLSAIRRVETARGEALDRRLRAALAYERAWALRALDRVDEAAGAYRDAIRHGDPGAVAGHARLELAELEIDERRYREAAALLRDLKRSPAAAPELKVKAAYRLGVCEMQLGRPGAAASELSAYLAAAPEPELVPSACLLAAEALTADGRVAEAAELLERVVAGHAASDEYGPSLLRLGECRATLQQWPRSVAAFEAYLQRFPGAPQWFQARFGIGWARENQGDLAGALSAYRDVVQRHQGPTAARAQFQIGECLFARQDYEAAARELLKVDIHYAYPEWSAAALYEAGRCFQAAGDPVNARRQYELVRDRHGETHWAQLAGERLEQLRETGLPGR